MTNVPFILMPRAARPASTFPMIQANVIYRRNGEPVHHVFHDYVRSEAMIPMRDGVKLHAVILKPADITAPLPILMQRTPYGVDGTNRSLVFCAAARAGARRVHLCGRRHSRPLQERRQVRDDAAARRSPRSERN